MTEKPRRQGISRRGFVTGALSAGAGAAVGAGATYAYSNTGQRAAPTSERPEIFVPFEGAHQTGITALPIPEQGLVASFNVQSKDRSRLTTALKELTEEIRGLMAGKRLVVPGFLNKLVVYGTVFVPRALLLPLVAERQRRRGR